MVEERGRERPSLAKMRPGMRRSMSAMNLSRAQLLPVPTDSEEDDDDWILDDSISDISLDTCFLRSMSADDEGEITDESEVEKEEQAGGGSSRHLGAGFQSAMMVVTATSFRRPKPQKIKKALTMEDIDVNNRTFQRFESNADFRQFRYDMAGGIAENETNRSRPTFGRENGNRSFEKISSRGLKAKEFEDIEELHSSRRRLGFDDDTSFDPFLSAEDEPDSANKKRRKKKKRSKKEREKVDGCSINWEQVDAKAKESLAAYNVSEGNIYPEISHSEQQKFRGSGNAWLEGRYSKNIDWKRDASGMTLEVPPPRRRSKESILQRPENKPLVTDRIKEKPKSQVRTQIILAPQPIKKLPPEKASAPIPDSHPQPSTSRPHPILPVDPAKSGMRSLLSRANSMPAVKRGAPAIKRGLQRAFKRSGIEDTDVEAKASLLADTSDDEEPCIDQTQEVNRNETPDASRICSKPSSEEKTLKKKSSRERSPKGEAKMHSRKSSDNLLAAANGEIPDRYGKGMKEPRHTDEDEPHSKSECLIRQPRRCKSMDAPYSPPQHEIPPSPHSNGLDDSDRGGSFFVLEIPNRKVRRQSISEKIDDLPRFHEESEKSEKSIDKSMGDIMPSTHGNEYMDENCEFQEDTHVPLKDAPVASNIRRRSMDGVELDQDEEKKSKSKKPNKSRRSRSHSHDRADVEEEIISPKETSSSKRRHRRHGHSSSSKDDHSRSHSRDSHDSCREDSIKSSKGHRKQAFHDNAENSFSSGHESQHRQRDSKSGARTVSSSERRQRSDSAAGEEEPKSRAKSSSRRKSRRRSSITEPPAVTIAAKELRARPRSGSTSGSISVDDQKESVANLEFSISSGMDYSRKSEKNHGQKEKRRSSSAAKERRRSSSLPKFREGNSSGSREMNHSVGKGRRRSSSLPKSVEDSSSCSRPQNGDKKSGRRHRSHSQPRKAEKAIAAAYDGAPDLQPRPRRRRSLNIDGDIISSSIRKSESTPTQFSSEKRKKADKSHQYVGFSETGRPTAHEEAAMNNKKGFLSRLASLGEEAGAKPTTPRRQMMQRAMSDRSFLVANFSASKQFKPTALPEGKVGTYSDLVMNHKIGVITTTME